MNPIDTWHLKEWSAREASQHYNVLSAVRGPDADGPGTTVLKWLLTARIRAIVFSLGECPGDYNPSVWNAENTASLQITIGKLSADCATRHVLHHILEAIKATQHHPVWGGHADEIAEKLTNFIAKGESQWNTSTGK